MSESNFCAISPVTRRVRAYFAPVNRETPTPVFFDPARQGAFALDAPPSPWIDLGWIQGFTRKSLSKSGTAMTGVPAGVQAQFRSVLEANVSFQFLSWTKLTMALATGSQHMNLLAGHDAIGSPDAGGAASPAIPVQNGSTATSIALADGADSFAVGSWIAVDVDYTGQTGFIGSSIAGAFLRAALSDLDYVRRVTFNVGLVTAVNGNTLTLAQPLPGGVPAAGCKVQAIAGFVDREGGSFRQEWSALFVLQGNQGERVLLHYPRLQTAAEATEDFESLNSKRKGSWQRMLLRGQFMAFPVTDPLDGERVLCYRTFLPASPAAI